MGSEVAEEFQPGGAYQSRDPQWGEAKVRDIAMEYAGKKGWDMDVADEFVETAAETFHDYIDSAPQ